MGKIGKLYGNEKEMEKFILDFANEYWNSIDKDKNGLDFFEFRNVIGGFGLADAASLMKIFDNNYDKLIDINELAEWTTHNQKVIHKNGHVYPASKIIASWIDAQGLTCLV